MDAKENEIYSAVLLAALVVGSIIAYFIFSMIRQNKKVLNLERTNAQAQISTLEKDRARIAADLHDDLAPMLVAVKMRINSFELTDVSDQKQLDSTNKIIDDLAKRMRAISFDLMPVSLQEKGLIMALQEFVNHISQHSDLNIRLKLYEQTIALSEQRTIHVYRMIQEIIHNTIKHAHASELVIAVKRQNEYLVVESQDNGVGFDHEQKLKESKGLGLKSLLNRVHLLRAEFTVDSQPGKGTAIRIQIPTADEYTVYKD
jgi:two-component system, NarL family, sensor kinase